MSVEGRRRGLTDQQGGVEDVRSTDTTNWTGGAEIDGSISGRAARRTVPAVPFEVLLGSGVITAWIVAIYVGLAFFKHLAGPQESRTATVSAGQFAHEERRRDRHRHA